MTESSKAGDILLEQFMHTFYGYGNFRGDYWFVGMEEGGGNSFAEISKRLSVWKTLGKGELVDVADFHVRLGIPEHFTEPVKLQPTWNKISRIVLSAEGQKITLDAVRAYQKKHLGRVEENTCLLELLPLPSPSTRAWLYARHSSLPSLRDRETYRNSTIPWRIEHLRQRIEEYRPRAVVFYGVTYEEHWKKIANLDFRPHEPFGFLVANSRDTTYIIAKHPVATGVTNGYFHQIGEVVA
jgi:hypothetical protein